MPVNWNILKPLEDFIVERGSAKVMGVHLQLLKDQLSILDREATTLAAQVANLQAANKNLTEQLQKRAAENHRLKNEAIKKQDAKTDRTEEEYLILAAIVKRNGDTLFGISISLGDDEGQRTQRTVLFLRRMQNDGLVSEDGNGRWDMTDDGREHLLVRDKL